jgi:hypothetical protein
LRIDSLEGNSVRQPLTPLPPFLKEPALDFSCFQELECDDAAFPRLEVEDARYDVGLHGQKAFNDTPLDGAGYRGVHASGLFFTKRLRLPSRTTARRLRTTFRDTRSPGNNRPRHP